MRLIDADALKQAIRNDVMGGLNYKRYIEEAQSIDAVPVKHGRWELIDDTEFRIPGYRCSVCHCECEDWEKKPTYKYCPNCGARMDERKE